MHHKGRNKHHYEYWYDLSKTTGGYAPVPMPVNYLLESFCDRIAACKVYQKDKYTDASPYKYFIDKHDGDAMHPESAALLSRWLLLLADRGEKAALKQIRGEYKAYKKEKKTAEKKLRRNQEN